MSLIAENLSLEEDGAYRLKHLNCEFEAGRLTVIIGPNGSGKSSLIKVLSGEIRPTEGVVSLEGIELAGWPPLELAKRRGVLAQQAVLDFPFQVRGVVALGRSPYRRSPLKDARLIDEAMDLFDIRQFADRLYTTLSGGERQRVHLARVWVQLSDFETGITRYILLDEPTSALDLRHQGELMQLLKNTLKHQPLGAVVVLHDLNAAALYADQLILLRQGRVIACGAREQVLSRENIEQAYGINVDILRYQASERQAILIPE